MFSISTAGDFLQKLQEDYSAFQQDFANAGKAMNCISSGYHIHEWVWAKWMKPIKPKNIDGKMIRDISDFVNYLDGACPHFKLVQDLTNGSKHLTHVSSTRRVSGFGRGPYGVGPFGKAYLLIDLGEDRPLNERYLTAHKMLGAVVEFWKTFFQKHGIP